MRVYQAAKELVVTDGEMACSYATPLHMTLVRVCMYVRERYKIRVCVCVHYVRICCIGEIHFSCDLTVEYIRASGFQGNRRLDVICAMVDYDYFLNTSGWM